MPAGRVIKSLEPYPKKLGTDTWFYAKRTFLALAETLAKHMIMLKVLRPLELPPLRATAPQTTKRLAHGAPLTPLTHTPLQPLSAPPHQDVTSASPRHLTTPTPPPPLTPQDATFHEILSFLDAIDACGKTIPTKVQDHPDKPVDAARCNVSFEARLLKKMFIKLRD